MADYSVGNAPGAVSYAAPLLDFSPLGNLGDSYYRGQNAQRQAAVADAFKGQQLPLDPSTGLPDYGKIMQVLASKGGIDAITKLAPSAAEQSLISRAGQISPLLSGGGATPASGGGPAPTPGSFPAMAVGGGSGVSAPQSLPAPPGAQASPSYVQGGDKPGSVVDLVSSRLPQDSPTTGAVISNIAKSVGVDPNSTLTPEQSALVTRRLDGYVARTGARGAPAGGAASPGGQAAALTPERLVAAGFTPERLANLGVQDRAVGATVEDRFGPAGPAAQPAAAAPAAATAPGAAAQSISGGQRIVPEVPLPPGYTDPQKAIMALRSEAARRSANPYDKQGLMLTQWADKIEASLQPIKIGQAETIYSPTGQVLAQGPLAAAYGARGGSPSPTIDADAERYRQTGTLPPNMGRGIQGQQEAQAIRMRATELEIASGGNPADLPKRWQEFRAQGIGMNTGERVRASREENLNLILKVTDAAIPAALEQSEKVWRTGFVPLNRIIQGGEIMTSDPELRAFGMANLQLAEGWARAMNPTGVMRNDDREKALSFLSTADSAATYKRLVMQLKTQITRERDSIKSGSPMRQGDSAPAPGVSTKAEGSSSGDWVPIKTKSGVSVEVQEIK